MAGLVTFTLTPAGGEAFEVRATKMDAIVVERELRVPILTRAQEGFFEPVLRLAFSAATRQKVIAEGTTFEQFVDTYDVALETDDEEPALGEA